MSGVTRVLGGSRRGLQVPGIVAGWEIWHRCPGPLHRPSPAPHLARDALSPFRSPSGASGPMSFSGLVPFWDTPALPRNVRDTHLFLCWVHRGARNGLWGLLVFRTPKLPPWSRWRGTEPRSPGEYKPKTPPQMKGSSKHLLGAEIPPRAAYPGGPIPSPHAPTASSVVPPSGFYCFGASASTKRWHKAAKKTGRRRATGGGQPSESGDTASQPPWAGSKLWKLRRCPPGASPSPRRAALSPKVLR